jgi:hypothetical protein
MQSGLMIIHSLISISLGNKNLLLGQGPTYAVYGFDIQVSTVTGAIVGAMMHRIPISRQVL